MGDDRTQVAFQTRMGEELVKMTSTLVETVSINYEDFNESFLTCGTCLCTYDGADHIPKLLPCSHTVCLHCLGRIVSCNNNNNNNSSITSTPQSSSSVLTSASVFSSHNVTESPKFRCPICRELITIPRGGVAALPPSFLVNQLLDLMASQRREVVPKCSTHSNQELLFCETCDSVFCASCNGSPHSNKSGSGDHTVIPFSIAIKRMSEILLYKANECLTKLDEASESVSGEMKRLSCAADVACEVANKAFEEAVLLLEKRRASYIANIHQVAALKKEKLKEQLDLIEKERAAVRATCEGLEYQVEVRHITKRISELSDQLDSFVSLRHPRENAYLLCKTESDLMSLESAVLTNIRTSSTFPPLCTLGLTSSPEAVLAVGLEVELLLETRDYNNKFRKEGGDPIHLSILCPDSSALPEKRFVIQDNEDGTYCIKFSPYNVGTYQVQVKIFGRPIKDCNVKVEISEHNNPTKIWGQEELCQPVSVAKNDNGEIFVLDTGNGRIVVLDQMLSLKKIVNNETLEGRSCTGLAYCKQTESLVVVNWRTKQVTRLSCKDGNGSTLGNFTHAEFIEPIGISVDLNGNIYVVDNGARTIFVFDSQGELKSKIFREKFELLGGVAISDDGNTLVVGDMALYIIDNSNNEKPLPDKEIKLSGSKGRFGGVTMDANGRILATRTEKGRSCVQVFKDTKLVSTIDSFDAKLKRPSDLAVTSNNNILVIDLGNDCVKQYRYK